MTFRQMEWSSYATVALAAMLCAAAAYYAHNAPPLPCHGQRITGYVGGLSVDACLVSP